jgi:hypothetical protein
MEVRKPGEWSMTMCEACWKAALSMTKTPKRTTNCQTTEIRDEDCMQVDCMKLEKLTKKEHKCLRKCRACFFCQKDSHMARKCPEKMKTSHSSASGGN